jgi:hypothetical protein
LPLSGAGFYRSTAKEKQPAEAKVDSCYPVALEKGHPTFHKRAQHRTASAVQISIQTTIYYNQTENTGLTGLKYAMHSHWEVGISLTTQFFLHFLRWSTKSGEESKF